MSTSIDEKKQKNLAVEVAEMSLGLWDKGDLESYVKDCFTPDGTWYFNDHCATGHDDLLSFAKAAYSTGSQWKHYDFVGFEPTTTVPAAADNGGSSGKTVLFFHNKMSVIPTGHTKPVVVVMSEMHIRDDSTNKTIQCHTFIDTAPLSAPPPAADGGDSEAPVAQW